MKTAIFVPLWFYSHMVYERLRGCSAVASPLDLFEELLYIRKAPDETCHIAMGRDH